MRLDLTIFGSLDLISGGFEYDRRLVAGFEAAGHQVLVHSLPWGNYLSQILLGLQPQWQSAIRAADPQLILQDELCHASLLRFNQRRGRAGPPIVSIVHHLRWREGHGRMARWFYRWVESAYLRSVDAFIFNSRDSQQSVADLLGRDPPGVIVYPGRPDQLPSLAPVRRRAEERLRLLFVGSLSRRKGILDLLAVLEQLPQQAFELQIVGPTDAQRKIGDQVQRMAKNMPNVHLHGQLGLDALNSAYAAADVVVVPSHLEGFGIVYLEAMCHGKPVIAGAEGGASELVEHGSTGFLVRAGDRQQLRSLLQQYGRDRALLHAHASAARARAAIHPTWRQSAQSALDFLLSLVSADRSDRPYRLVDQPYAKGSTP